MKTNYTVIILLFQLLLSCSNPKPERKDFIGTWKSDDGAMFQLHEDGSITAKQINLSKIFFEDEMQANKLDFTGKWEFATDNYQRRIIKVTAGKYTFSFNITGQGITENKPPWYLFAWIGDPDEMDKYEFRKT